MQIKIFELKFLIPLIGLLLLSCNSETASITPEPTPVYQGPLVMSNSPYAVVEAWKYISPDDEGALTSFLSQEPDVLPFGEGHHEAHIQWRENGFDLVWGNVLCSTEPILIIDEKVMTLWLNDGIWDDCEAMSVPHAFRVELKSDISPDEWTYTISEGNFMEELHEYNISNNN